MPTDFADFWNSDSSRWICVDRDEGHLRRKPKSKFVSARRRNRRARRALPSSTRARACARCNLRIWRF